MHPEAHCTALARQLSAALCLVLVCVFAWGAYRQTAGFDTWTFEGRRQLQLANGDLRAPTVAMHQAFGNEALIWPSAAATPAAFLVDFIYVRCPSVCLSLGSQYQQMQRRLQNDPTLARVQLASISFDVAHDGRTELRQLAGRLGADAAHWGFAVPASDGDAHTLLHALGVVAISDGAGGFVHNGGIHLLDREGRLRGLFSVDEWAQALAAAGRLAQQAEPAAP